MDAVRMQLQKVSSTEVIRWIREDRERSHSSLPLLVPNEWVLLKWGLPSDDELDADKAVLLRAAMLEELVNARVSPALALRSRQ